jgi:hypothetical protein
MKELIQKRSTIIIVCAIVLLAAISIWCFYPLPVASGNSSAESSQAVGDLADSAVPLSGVGLASAEGDGEAGGEGVEAGEGAEAAEGQGVADAGAASAGGTAADGAGSGGIQNGSAPSASPSPPADVAATYTCVLSVNCSTVLNNWDALRESKRGFVPGGGSIYYNASATFTEGETVYDVLSRELRNSGIQMDSTYNSVYGSAYIKGINNLYEFDCGQLSGWMYAVNGWYPNYGCSSYKLNNGDRVAWNYTCDLGRDLGAPQS